MDTTKTHAPPPLCPTPKVALRVWDLPIRLFHWSLVLLIGVSLLSGKKGEMEVHMASGLFLLTLLLFRFLWGIVGSTTARFSYFLCGPRSLWTYLNGLWKGLPGYSPVGHNPAGGLAIVLMLTVLTVQATSGLFANDDIYTKGPLAHLVENETSDALTTIHKYNVKLMLSLIGLHILANLFYLVIKGENLILPMITGKKYTNFKKEEKNLHFVSTYIALFLMILSSVLVYFLINFSKYF